MNTLRFIADVHISPLTITSQRLLSILPELEQSLIEGYAITIEDNSVRLRRLPIR